MVNLYPDALCIENLATDLCHIFHTFGVRDIIIIIIVFNSESWCCWFSILAPPYQRLFIEGGFLLSTMGDHHFSPSLVTSSSRNGQPGSWKNSWSEDVGGRSNKSSCYFRGLLLGSHQLRLEELRTTYQCNSRIGNRYSGQVFSVEFFWWCWLVEYGWWPWVMIFLGVVIEIFWYDFPDVGRRNELWPVEHNRGYNTIRLYGCFRK